MFSFRNKLSPTTSTMLRLNRSPCTITVHHYPGAEHPYPGPEARAIHDAFAVHAALARGDGPARVREAEAVRLMVALLRDAVERHEHAGAGQAMEPVAGTPPALPLNGFPAQAAALLVGVAAALYAAGALALGRTGQDRLAARARETALPEPAQH